MPQIGQSVSFASGSFGDKHQTPGEFGLHLDNLGVLEINKKKQLNSRCPSWFAIEVAAKMFCQKNY